MLQPDHFSFKRRGVFTWRSRRSAAADPLSVGDLADQNTEMLYRRRQSDTKNQRGDISGGLLPALRVGAGAKLRRIGDDDAPHDTAA